MKRIINAFWASWNAIKFGWYKETALKQEMLLFIIALPAAWFLTSNAWKYLALIGVVLLVMIVEFLNTGIEKLADKVTLEHDELIGIAKDCGSAAVLFATIISTSVWLLALWEAVFRLPS